jgi:Spy/CpxP family protein refolding chaperone
MLLTVALSGALSLGMTVVAVAQDTSDPSQTQMQGRRGRGQQQSPEQQLAKLTQELGLTSDEQQQILPLLQDQQQKMQALTLDGSLSMDDRRTQIQAIRKDTNSQIEPLLTDEQKTKFEALMTNAHHGGGGQGGQQPSGSMQPQV